MHHIADDTYHINKKMNQEIVMEKEHSSQGKDHDMNPYVTNVERLAIQNQDYRKCIWTGCYLQMTVMHIPSCSKARTEIHRDTDQYIRIEQGSAVIRMGRCRECLDYQASMCCGDVAFIPSNTWHSIQNIGRIPLKVSVIYAPPYHLK